MPLVCLFFLLSLSLLPLSGADSSEGALCKNCNIFNQGVEISGSKGIPAAVRGRVYQGGPIPIHDASERNSFGSNRGVFDRDPFDDPGYRVVPNEPSTRVISFKRLSHKPVKAARKEFEKAAKLSEKGDSAGVIAHLTKAVEIDPQYVEALNNLGARYVLIGDYTTAITHLNRAIELDPHSVQPYCNLSLAFLGMEDPAASERAARQAVDNDPSDAKARYLLGISLVTQRKLTREMLDTLRKAQDRFPQAQIALAVAEAAMGNTAGAKSTLQDYLKRDQAPKREEAAQILASLEAEDKMAAK